MTNPAPQTPNNTLRTVALILLPILGIALVAAAIFATRSKEKAAVTVVVSEGQPGAPAINTGDVIDATVPDAIIVPQMGYRYKVFVDDESDDRSSGIAKIGGLVTFIPGARPGQTAIVDVTRVRESVADATLVKVLSQIEVAPRAPRAPRASFTPPPGDSSANVIAGAEMDVVVTEASSKNPTTEGIARVNGLVVVVNGVTTIGQRVNVRITDRREKLAFAEPTGKPAGTEPLPTAAAPAAPSAPRGAFVPPPGDPVVLGAEMDVVVTEASDKNPTADGVARVGGLVVVVNGVTTIGQRVNVRITGRLEKVAFAEPTGKPAGTEPLPTVSAPAAPSAPRGAFVPPPGDPVVLGAEMDVVVTEASDKNPTMDGVARVGGLVVVVNGVTTIGQRVNVRITGRLEKVAFAEPTGKPVGTEPLPVQAAPSAPRPPRPTFVPPPGDSMAYIVPGAVIGTTITEPSTKNPTTEGVAKINGFVIFVKGATTIGQAVNVRITERRQHIAIGEVTADAITAMPPPPPAPVPPAMAVPAETASPAAPAAAPAPSPAAEEAPAVVPEPAAP
jgi:predicted RNA-binding protein with TRAM domain